MNQPIGLMVQYINECLSGITKAPQMWGGPESVELQAMLLLELKALALRPHSFLRDHREFRKAYLEFVEREFGSLTRMHSALIEDDRLLELPTYITKLRSFIDDRLPAENPLLESDIALELQFSRRSNVPFAKVCGYFTKFQRSVNAAVIGARQRRALENRPFRVPSITEIPPNGSGPRVRIAFDNPDPSEQFDPFNVGSTLLNALDNTMTVADWACYGGNDVDAIRGKFFNNKAMRRVASATIGIFPGDEIEAVTIGGASLHREPLTIRAESTHRVLRVIDEETEPKAFDKIGNVERADFLQKWFILRVKHRVYQCWTPMRYDLFEKAVASAPAGKIRVQGTEHRAHKAEHHIIVKEVLDVDEPPSIFDV